MNQYAIVAIGYNRVNSMARLLDSLDRVEYDGDEITLIVSLDNCGNDAVYNYVNQFQWRWGNKIIRTFPERQGLKRHILACGDYLNEYDAIAVFEDDITAAPGFYRYMKQAVAYYHDDENIAGISLYNHAWNVNAVQTFYPEASRYDVYFLQFAQSWGQVWMKKQWFAFKQWLSENDGESFVDEQVPAFVTNWPRTSWLKHHVRYCIQNNKYFVYPYLSQTTCFSDIGQHATFKNTVYQVPVCTDAPEGWKFVPLAEAPVKYDAFFEREDLGAALGLADDELTVDLYGTKPRELWRRYVLTMKGLPNEVKSSYALDYRPHELNAKLDLRGNDIFLYDTAVSAEAPETGNVELKQFMFHQRMVYQNKRMIMLLKANLRQKLKKLRKK